MPYIKIRTIDCAIQETMSKSVVQRLRWGFESVSFIVLRTCFRMLPLAAASALGGWMNRLLGPVMERRELELNLAHAFPDLTPASRRQIAIKHWENFGRYCAELFMIDRIHRDRIEILGMEHVDDLDDQYKSVIFVSGHFANWDVMHLAGQQLGIDLLICYRPIRNPYLEQLITSGRGRGGRQLLAIDGISGARRLVEASKTTRSIAILCDVKAKTGPYRLFLGRPVRMAATAIKVCLRSGRRLHFVSVRRMPGVHFRVTVHPPVFLTRSANLNDDVDAGMAKFMEFLEFEIRTHPQDWCWSNKIWG